jgi:ribosome-binding factor A
MPEPAVMDEIRRKRVEEELRDIIASLILGGQVKDPRVGPLISVTRVEAAKDLSTARVFISTFAGDIETTPIRDRYKDLDTAVQGLQSAAGFIQGQLARRMKTRLTPKLTFIGDRGIKEGFELTEKMKDIIS